MNGAPGTAAEDVDASDKLAASVAARLALLGFSLHRLADGSFLVAKWSYARPLPDLRSVSQFLHQVGGLA